jgi:hypothetical protein
MANMTAAKLIGWTLFGAVGFVAFVYGKKQNAIRALFIGLTLMVYPYFVSNTVAMYAIGAVLTVALFIFRD